MFHFMKWPVTCIAMMSFAGCVGGVDGVDSIDDMSPMDGDHTSHISEVKQSIEWGRAARFGQFQTFTPNALPELYWAGGSVQSTTTVAWDNWHKVPNAQPGLSGGYGGIGQAARLDGWLDVFYIGSGGTVAHSFLDSSWYADDWGKPAGYNLFGHVGVASWGSDRLDVFVLGTTSPLSASSYSYANVTLFHRYWTPSGASGWVSWGAASGPMGYINSGVSAVSWGGSRIDVFGKNPGGAGLKHWYSTDGVTFGSDTWPTAYTEYGAPSAVSWGDQRLDVFYRGSSNSVYELRHVVWDHGAFFEDSWGKPCPSWTGFLLGATAANMIGVSPYVGVQVDICSNTDPGISPFRSWNGLAGNWMSPEPGHDIPGLWSNSVYGSGALLVW